jgi:multiple sugar transport system substrate-binding protein
MTPLFYRTDLLQAAGFDRPPKSQIEFSSMARSLTDKTADRYGFALSLTPEDPQGVYQDILPWFRSSGADLFLNDSPEFSGPQVLSALAFLNGLYREGLIAPETFTRTEKDLLEDFSAGRVAMMIASIGEARTLQAEGVPFGITTIPGPDGYIGKPSVGITSWYAGLSRSSRHEDEGRAFLAFLAEKAPVIAKNAGAVPGAISFSSADPEESAGASKYSLETLPLYAKAYDIYEAGDIPGEFPGLPGQNALETILREELQVMFEHGRSPEETAKAVQARWEAILSAH